MNELLQKHGCSNVFSVPEGLKELMADITREVLREQPAKILEFITNYLSVLLITREHGILAVKILEDLCDCKPTVSEHLLQIGLEKEQAEAISNIIKEEIESAEPVLEGKAKVKESQIVKKALKYTKMDEEMTAKVCQVARNAYKDYWYRKQLLEKSLEVHPDEPWEIAAQHTLELYKRTKPSLSELNRATVKIQAAYRGYHVRRNLLKHLRVKASKHFRPKAEMAGPPLDVAGSREMNLGPVIDIIVQDQNVCEMFGECIQKDLNLQYDPIKTITHVEGLEMMDAQVQRMQFQKPTFKPSTILELTIERRRRLSSQAPAPATLVHSFEGKDHSEDSISVKASTPPQMRSRSSRPISHTEISSAHKISFAALPPEVIPDDDILEQIDDEDEVPEDITVDSAGDADEVESVRTASVASTPTEVEDLADMEDVDTSAGEDQ